MPSLLTTAPYIDPLTGQPFTGLLYLAPGAGSGLHSSCLVVRIDGGSITEACSYLPGGTGTKVSLPIPVQLTPTGTGETLQVGFEAGNPDALLLNLAASGACSTFANKPVEIPSIATLEVSALCDNPAGPDIVTLLAENQALAEQVAELEAAIIDCESVAAAQISDLENQLTALQQELAQAQAGQGEEDQAGAVLDAVNAALTSAEGC